jgi:small subunit ribosomal protein S20
MANTKTAKANIKINERNRKRNVHLRSVLRTASKKALTAIEENAKTKSETVKDCLQTIDKSVTKGILHKNTAARSKSRLMKKLNASAK